MNYFGFFFPVKRKQGVNNCFKPLISFALLLLSFAASRLKSEQKEKEKEILKLNTTQTTKYFKAMLNAIDFYKGIFLHVTLVCIIVP